MVAIQSLVEKRGQSARYRLDAGSSGVGVVGSQVRRSVRRAVDAIEEMKEVQAAGVILAGQTAHERGLCGRDLAVEVDAERAGGSFCSCC